jgi:hypothetical protein
VPDEGNIDAGHRDDLVDVFDAPHRFDLGSDGLDTLPPGDRESIT